MNTVADLAEQTGWSEQKVRRLLTGRLGDKGMQLVLRKKGKRTKANPSPRDVFFLDPARRDDVRYFLQSR